MPSAVWSYGKQTRGFLLSKGKKPHICREGKIWVVRGNPLGVGFGLTVREAWFDYTRYYGCK